MTTLNWKNTVMWTALSLLFLLIALMVGPAPALAEPKGIGKSAGVVLYEITEDMYIMDAQGNPLPGLVPGAAARTAVAQLSGFAKLGTPLCPWEVLHLTPGAKQCTVNATGADNLSLATGKGTVSGTYAVVVQDTNTVDAPEFVVMTGTFKGDADLSLAFANQAPLGYITNGQATIDGAPVGFGFGGTFRLPFGLTREGQRAKPKRYVDALYLNDNFKPVSVDATERSLGWATVRLEISFQ
jgi:hypothetical protein